MAIKLPIIKPTQISDAVAFVGSAEAATTPSLDVREITDRADMVVAPPAVAAQTAVQQPTPAQQQVTSSIQPMPSHDLAALTQRVEILATSLSQSTAQIGEYITTNLSSVTKRVINAESTLKAEHDHANDLDSEVAMLQRRLDAIDEILSAHSLPSTKTVTIKPMLTLRPRRRIQFPAKEMGDGVAIYYNPRQGVEGGDAIEFTITPGQSRNVFTGYVVDVPPGYVCDIFVGPDAVASLCGPGDGELIVAMRTRGTWQHVNAGKEICRLTLRRLEALTMRVIEA